MKQIASTHHPLDCISAWKILYRFQATLCGQISSFFTTLKISTVKGLVGHRNCYQNDWEKVGLPDACPHDKLLAHYTYIHILLQQN
jgi:hypothetical protein